MGAESKDTASGGDSGDVSKGNRTVRELHGTRGARAEKSAAGSDGPNVGKGIDGAIQTRIRSSGKKEISFSPGSGGFLEATGLIGKEKAKPAAVGRNFPDLVCGGGGVGLREAQGFGVGRPDKGVGRRRKGADFMDSGAVGLDGKEFGAFREGDQISSGRPGGLLRRHISEPVRSASMSGPKPQWHGLARMTGRTDDELLMVGGNVQNDGAFKRGGDAFRAAAANGRLHQAGEAVLFG